MFEGNILHIGHEVVARDASGTAEGLRALSWGELVARLDASRDFRRVMEAQSGAPGGSFNRTSARHLAALGDGKPGINPFALANGKMAESMSDTVTKEELTGDRGRQ